MVTGKKNKNNNLGLKISKIKIKKLNYSEK